MFQLASICEPVCARADTLLQRNAGDRAEQNRNVEASRCDDNETLT